MGKGGGSSSAVFIKDKELAWIPAIQTGESGGKATVEVPKYPDEQSIACDGGKGAKGKETKTVNLKDYPANCLPLQNVDANGNLLQFPDMVELPYLHEAAILFNLKQRHWEGKPYTRTGDIIIAINPFQWFTHLYTEKVRMHYSNKIVWTTQTETDPRKELDPHVYETSSLVFQGLAFDKVPQSILVSGESGAGKTETVKICMNHIASVQRGPVAATGEDKFEDPVVNRILQSNPLLEAFGNAKTVRNDNSSRFGKYLMLQFEDTAPNAPIPSKTESCCFLAGSKCETYLLEKNRITGHESEERTYHVFYQICAAPEAEKVKYWDCLSGTSELSFKYVGKSPPNTLIDGMTDEQHFGITVKTLNLIDVKGDDLTALIRAISAVLQCGNVTFSAKDGDNDKSMITSTKEAKDLANLMGVQEEDVSLAFTERTMKTRNETYKVPLNKEVAKESADALAKEIYNKLFLWLVDQINLATDAAMNYKRKDEIEYGTIGLLDIFGFESFKINKYEQLCINFANEKLQQKFTEDIFQSVQAEYEAEGIALAEITYDDNSDVLELIEGRTGIMAMLNEECVRPKGNDATFVNKALGANKKKPALIINPMNKSAFGVHHFAGKVMYDGNGFVARNTDNLPSDLEDCMFKSTNFIIAMKPTEPAGTAKAAPKRSKSNLVGSTVWNKYKTQMASLMGNLRATRSRYIRCLKPNKPKKPSIMEHMGSVEQLRCAGVVAAVTITRSAFPNRLDNTAARKRFEIMWNKTKFPPPDTSGKGEAEALKAVCEVLFTCALKEREEDGKQAFVIGKTRTYFRAGALEYLEANRAGALFGVVQQMQRPVRGYLARRRVYKILHAAEEAERLRKLEEEKAKKAAEEAARAAEEAERMKAEEGKRKKAEEKLKKQREKEEKLRKLEEMKRKKEEEKMKKEAEKRKQEELEKEKKELEKLEKEVEKKKKLAEEEAKNIEKKLKEEEEKVAELRKKYEAQQAEAAKLPKDEIANLEKKAKDSDKIVKFLKKENMRLRKETEQMEEDLVKMKETNNRLIEANASAGASLDSLNKQAKVLEDHNKKLEVGIGKYAKENKKLKHDLRGRQQYVKAETQIRNDYEQAMEKIVKMMEDRCTDSELVEKIMTAQLTCVTNIAQS